MDTLLETLHGLGLIPVIKIENADDAVPLCRALQAGGLPVAEITFRTEAAAEALGRVRRELPDMLAGAGTVTSLDYAEQALEAGAQFIVTPGFNPEVVHWCLKRNIPVLPGCTTASEVEMAQNLGLRVVKFFPAEQSGGLAKIKALSGPYPKMRFIPTGGINAANLMEYLASDKVLACGGSFMVGDALVRAKDWEKITAITQQAMEDIVGLTLERVGFAADSEEHMHALSAQCAAFAGTPACNLSGGVRIGRGLQLNPKHKDILGTLFFSAHNLERACFRFRRQGMAFDEASASRDGNGRLRGITFAEKLNGFAVCLVRKDG